eukprot:7556663-Alexandrium_andersonii.AAC.1
MAPTSFLPRRIWLQGASGQVTLGPKKDHWWLQAAINIAWPESAEQDLRPARVGRSSTHLPREQS